MVLYFQTIVQLKGNSSAKNAAHQVELVINKSNHRQEIKTYKKQVEQPEAKLAATHSAYIAEINMKESYHDHKNVKRVLRRFTGKHAKYGPVYVPVDERKSKPTVRQVIILQYYSQLSINEGGGPCTSKIRPISNLIVIHSSPLRFVCSSKMGFCRSNPLLQ